jgi:hypothetical protein
VALLLRQQGIKRIRPLEGGLLLWRQRGYSLERPVSEFSAG